VMLLSICKYESYTFIVFCVVHIIMENCFLFICTLVFKVYPIIENYFLYHLYSCFQSLYCIVGVIFNRACITTISSLIPRN
jgi:hypothetical protein